MSDTPQNTLETLEDLTGQPFVVIHCSPETWLTLQQTLAGVSDSLFTDGKYVHPNYPNCVLALGSSIDLNELSWLEEKYPIEEGVTFLKSNLPSTFY